METRRVNPWFRLAILAALLPQPLPHIFGRFYRADPSRSQVEGSGLGLSIARWIANIHQAALSVDSKQNAGSVFRIVFPLLAVDSRQPDASQSAGSLTSVG